MPASQAAELENWPRNHSKPGHDYSLLTGFLSSAPEEPPVRAPGLVVRAIGYRSAVYSFIRVKKYMAAAESEERTLKAVDAWLTFAPGSGFL